MRLSRPKPRRRVIVVAGLAAVAAALPVTFAGAVPPTLPSQSEQHDTSATVNGSGNSTVNIECAWAMPDMVQPNGGPWGAPANATQMNYGTVNGPASGYLDDDDDPRLAGVQCTTEEGTFTRPDQPDQPTKPAAPQIDATPNLDDKVNGNPHLRWIELWAAVDGAGEQNPLAQVYWRVLHPDGSFKVQVEGSNYTPADTVDQCDGPSNMFPSAIDTGQLAPSAVGNTTPEHDSLIDWCLNGEKDLYYGAFGLSKHQPWGWYLIEAHVVNGTNHDILNYWIYVKPVVGFATDFTEVNFGQVGANQAVNVTGDTTFNSPAAPVTPTSTNRPSVQSTGNTAITVEVGYSNMCYVLNPEVSPPTPYQYDCGTAKEIRDFDVKLGSHVSTVEAREVANPPSPTQTQPYTPDIAHYMNMVQQITSAAGPRYRSLCPNDIFKIDFSLHTPGSLTPGTYDGEVYLRVIPYLFANPTGANAAGVTANGVPIDGSTALPPYACPTDQGHEYYPFTDPVVTVDPGYDGTTPRTTGYQIPAV